MPEIPRIGVQSISVPEIPAWRAMPPQSIPSAPPITLQIGFPVAEIPGCVETRDTQPGNSDAYDTDPKGNFVVCGGEMPSFTPMQLTPGIAPPEPAKVPTPDVDIEKAAGVSSQPQTQSPSTSSEPLDLSKIVTELPCPPPDAIPLGAKNKSQTAVVIGYELIDDKCTTIYERLDVPTIIGNYLPGAPVVTTTATIAAVATTAAIFARPLGNFLLKAVKPTVKKVIKKINEKLGRKVVIESSFQRRMNQRALRK